MLELNDKEVDILLDFIEEFVNTSELRDEEAEVYNKMIEYRA